MRIAGSAPFRGTLVRAARFLASALLVAAAVHGRAAHADVANGKSLYFNIPGSPWSCSASQCHGSNPSANVAVMRGANAPAVIQNAINTKSQMLFLSNYLNSTQIADIAEYLGSSGMGLSTASLAFGSQQVGTTSAVYTVTITNNGVSSLALNTIAIGGANPGDFSKTASSTCNNGSTVAAKNSCTIVVTFTPTAASDRGANISIVSNAPGSPHSVSLSGAGTPAPTPAASLSATALAFGDQTVGVPSGAQSVTLSSTGSGGASLTVSNIAVVGDYALGSGTDACTTGQLANGGSCYLFVSFTPATSGTRNGTVTITDDAGGASNATQTISLTGTGVAPAPAASLSATSVSFGNQVVNATGATQTVTLSNSGSATLTIASIVLGGVNPGDFGMSGSCAAGTLPAGGSCTIVLSFTPTVAGDRFATVTVTDDAGGSVGSTQAIALAGTGVAVAGPAVDVSPGALTFSSQIINTTSASQSVSFTNTSATSAWTITAVSLAGAQAGDFALDAAGTCVNGVSITAGGSCTVVVTFTPIAIGARSASVSVVSNAAGNPSVTLSGTGSATPVPGISITPASLGFGNQPVNSTSAAQVFTVTNTGNAALVLNQITRAGANAADFATAGSCASGVSVPAGQNCTLAITFSPSAAGLRGASVSVTSNASTQTVSVSGTGTTPALTLSETNHDFQSRAVGSATERAITLTNTGTATLALNQVSRTGTHAADFATAGTCANGVSVPAGQSCTLSIIFSPSAAGVRSAAVSIMSSVPTQTIGVSGIGVSTTGGSTNTTGANVGGGGCTIARGTSSDTTLVLLLLGAMWGWGQRCQRRHVFEGQE